MTFRKLVEVGVSAQEYKEYQDNPQWREFVQAVKGAEYAKGFAGCGKMYRKYDCDNGHEVWKAIHCSDGRYCPRCSRLIREAAARDDLEVAHTFYSRLGRMVEFASFEFTVPRDMQLEISDEHLGDLRTSANAIVAKLLSDHGNIVPMGKSCVQWWHTSNPFLGNYPHVHGVVYSLVFDKELNAPDVTGATNGKGDFRQINLYLSREQLDEMRALWLKALYAYGKTKSKNVVVRWHVSRGYGRLAHRLSYMHRGATNDFFRYVTQARFFEAVMASPNVDWVRRCLERPAHFKHVSGFGMLAESRMYKWAERLGLSIPRKPVRDRARKRVKCPHCGLFMTPQQVVKSLGELKQTGAEVLAWCSEDYPVLRDWGKGS